MEMDYLCEFAEIARLGSFSLAAEAICMSQSSLSKHIMALEKELDVRLLNRTSRSVALSEAGALLLPYAEQALKLRNKIQKAAAEQSRRDRAVIHLASIPVMAQYDITGAIARFNKEYPDIMLSVSEYESHEILRLLESGDCDLAFTRRLGENTPGFESIDFCRDCLVAVLPCSHPLANEKNLGLGQLVDEDFLFLDKGTSLYALCYDLCTGMGFHPKVKFTGHRPENIVDLVSQGMGIALLMKRHTDYIKNSGVRAVAVAPAVESTVSLTKLRDRRLSRPVKLFWDYIDNSSPP